MTPIHQKTLPHISDEICGRVSLEEKNLEFIALMES